MTPDADNLVRDLVNGFVEDCQVVLEHVAPLLKRLESAGGEHSVKTFGSLFQAAHSLKAGAGMAGLDGVKLLAQKLENLLHLLRRQQLAPTSESISALLDGFGQLKELLGDLPDSAMIYSDALVARLAALAVAPGGQDMAKPMTIPVGSAHAFSIDPVSLAQAAADGNEVYLLEYDLERDPEVQGRAPLEFLRTLLEAGRIVDCMVDLSAADGIPFHVVFATLLAPRFAMAVAKLPQDRVRQLTPDEAAEPVPLPTSFQEEFGAAVLTVADGAGRIASPKHLEGHSLDNVHVALLAGMTRCSRLVVDFGGIEQCDVFFFQLLCAAQHAYNARGLRLSTEGALEPDLSKAATTMGFGCNGTPGCLFNAS